MRRLQFQTRGSLESAERLKRNSRLHHFSKSAPVLCLVAVSMIYASNYPGEITIDASTSGTVSQPSIRVTGTVENQSIQTILLDVNGSARAVTVTQGRFESQVPLVSGKNIIHASVPGAIANLIGGSNVARVVAQIPPSDIWTELNWEGAGDIDLHVYLPNDEHCFYGNKQTQAGAALDVDNKERDGPEHISMTKAIPGTYRVTVLYYAAKDGPPRIVPWQVTVRLNGGRAQTYTGQLRGVGEEQTVETFTLP